MRAGWREAAVYLAVVLVVLAVFPLVLLLLQAVLRG